MQVDLALERNRLVFQESTRVRITLHNNRNEPVTVFDPVASGVSPVLRLTDAARGRTINFPITAAARALDPHFLSEPGGPPIRVLQPQEHVEVDEDLLAWVGTLEPGRYIIQAIVDCGELHAASSATSFTVERLRLGAITRQAYTSSSVPWWDIAFAHEQADRAGAVIVLRTIELDEWAGLQSGVRLGTGPAGTVPLSSTSPPGIPAQGHWVTWLDGNAVAYAYEHQGRVLRPSARASVPHAFALVEPPLQALALQRPPGELWQFVLTGPSSRGWEIAALHVDPAGHADLAGSVTGSGSRPQWAWAAQFRGGCYVLTIAQEPAHVHLDVAEWPTGATPRARDKLATWDGEFIASTAIPLENEQLAGVTLLRVPDPDKRLRLIAWTLDNAGRLQTSAPRPVHWVETRGLRHLVLRVDATGAAYGLVQATQGDWSLFDADGATMPVPDLPRDPPALDLLFFQGHVPIVQLADDTGRLRYRSVDGHVMPAW